MVELAFVGKPLYKKHAEIAETHLFEVKVTHHECREVMASHLVEQRLGVHAAKVIDIGKHLWRGGVESDPERLIRIGER